jgi:hypothetical protein
MPGRFMKEKSIFLNKKVPRKDPPHKGKLVRYIRTAEMIRNSIASVEIVMPIIPTPRLFNPPITITYMKNAANPVKRKATDTIM